MDGTVGEIRHLAAFMVGTSRLAPTVFAGFAYSGALIWASCFVGLGYAAGEEWQQFIPLLHRILHTAMLAGFAVLPVVSAGLLLWRFR